MEVINDSAEVPTASLTPAAPVFRYYYPSNGAHFYTTNPAAEHLTGWIPEGIRFYAYATPMAGLKPIYRYMYNADTTLHYFTPDGGGAPISGWTYEGIGWYVLAINDDRNSRAPLNAYQNQANANLYFYTSNPSGENLSGYSPIGTIGYVYDINDLSISLGQLITENSGRCLGIKVIQGSFADTSQGLTTFGPFKVGDYAMVRARLVHRDTCIQGGANTLIVSEIGPWVPPAS